MKEGTRNEGKKKPVRSTEENEQAGSSEQEGGGLSSVSQHALFYENHLGIL